MKRFLELFRHTRVIFVAAATTVTGMGVAMATGPDEPGTVLYSGRAIVLDANASLLTSKTRVVLADTGELDNTGATRENTVVTFDNPPPIEVHSQTAHAITAGANNVSASNAAVEKLVLKVGLLRLSADVIDAQSTAECRLDSGTVHPSGTSTISNLVINGVPIVRDTSKPNTKIGIPGVATVILNHQTQPDVNTLWVNAIRVIVPGVPGIATVTIDIAHAEAGIRTCAKEEAASPSLLGGTLSLFR